MYDIFSFDAELGKTLQELLVLVHRKQFLESSAGDNQQALADLCFRGAPIEDLCLDFTLPGYPEYILKEDKESTIVRDNNLDLLIFWVLYCFLDFPFNHIELVVG